MIYWQLFYSFLKIGFFGFGGGYAMLSLIQHEVVEKHGWLSVQQFTDIVAVSQMTPGPISINSATYIGYSVSGNVWGAVLATLAVCVPPMTIMLVLTKFYLKFRENRYVGYVMDGLRPMIVGMIGAASFLLMTPSNFPNWISVAIFGVCLALSFRKVNPIWLILGSAVFGMVFL